ncbi:MAG: TfoX/Sxy family protein [Acidobacteria bacterium]|nr:TfoX/Sxy family protein [Acidobacteriota bacterium]
MKTDSFKEFTLEQLSDLAELVCRRMFSGWGLYSGEIFFGIISGGQLYLKTDATSRKRYLKMGMGPFRPRPRQTLWSYYRVPVDVLEDRDRLRLWAETAVRAQRQSKPARRRNRGRRVPAGEDSV